MLGDRPLASANSGRTAGGRNGEPAADVLAHDRHDGRHPAVLEVFGGPARRGVESRGPHGRIELQPSAGHCSLYGDPAGHPFCLSTWDEVPS